MVQKKASRLARKNDWRQYIHIRAVIRIVVFGLLLYLVVVGIGGLSSGMSALHNANLTFVGLAVAAVALTYVAAAFTYYLLSPLRIYIMPTLCIQVASGLVNRLLPAGIGGLGINAAYLAHNGLPLPVAAAVVTTNTVLGFLGNALLIAGIFIFTTIPAISLHVPAVPLQAIVLPAVIVIVLGLLYALRRHLQKKIRLGLHDAVIYMQRIFLKPIRSSVALGSSMALTALHASGLYFVLVALHAHQDWPVALLAISIGAIAGAAVPTPGGLGGAEAGIATTLIAFGSTNELAIAAALIYRGITYWLPLLPGYFAFRLAEKRYL
jgi:uncharacterized protein (TIRG00374 family)